MNVRSPCMTTTFHNAWWRSRIVQLTKMCARSGRHTKLLYAQHQQIWPFGQRLRISMSRMPSSRAAPAPMRVATAALSCAHGQYCSIAADAATLILWLACNSEEADIQQSPKLHPGPTLNTRRDAWPSVHHMLTTSMLARPACIASHESDSWLV